LEADFINPTVMTAADSPQWVRQQLRTC